MKGLQEGKEFTVNIKDDAHFIEALALVDKVIIENPSDSVFPIHDGYIHNYLQLFVDIEGDYIYDDVGLSPYAPDEQGFLRKFNPIRDNLSFNLYPDSVIDLQQDVGCGGEKVKNRLDIGKFKNILRKKYGKDHEFFAHYFQKSI